MKINIITIGLKMIKVKNFLIVTIHYILWSIEGFIPFSWGWDYSTPQRIYHFVLLISAIVFKVNFVKKKSFIAFAFLLVFSFAMALTILATIRGL